MCLFFNKSRGVTSVSDESYEDKMEVTQMFFFFFKLYTKFVFLVKRRGTYSARKDTLPRIVGNEVDVKQTEEL